MRALRFTAHGGPEALEVAEVPVPVAGPGEVLVEVRAAGVNPSDVGNVRGAFPATTLPRTPGRDVAGVVVEGPAHLVGRPVWASGKAPGFTRDGTHAAYVALPADGVALKPEALGFEEAARCGVPYTTAWACLERAGVGAGTRLAVLGAHGAVGRAAVDLGRWRGAEVLEVVRGPQTDDLEAAVRAVFPAGAEVIVDTTGHLAAAAVDALAHGGRLAIIAAPKDEHVPLPLRRFYHLAATLVGVDSLAWACAEVAPVLARLARGFDTAALPPPPAPSVFPLADGPAAYAAVASRQVAKAVLVPADTDRSGRNP